ncbi:MAG: hypothetical protein LBL92_05205, partial [Propionibacteriaceae bacterium]|nr:hypothetical protein [Propionibacteriaceae bacterium]
MTQNPDPQAGYQPPASGYQPPVPPAQPSHLDLPPIPQPSFPPPNQANPPQQGYAPPPTAAPGYGQSSTGSYATPGYGQTYQPTGAAYPTPTPNAGANFIQSRDEDIQKNKGMAVLSYIGILVLIPLLAAKNSSYARFHAGQGLTLFAFSLAVGILSRILAAIGGFFSGILVLLLGLVSIGLFVLAIMGIV